MSPQIVAAREMQVSKWKFSYNFESTSYAERFLNGKSYIVIVEERIVSLAATNTMFATRKHGVYPSQRYDLDLARLFIGM